MLISIKQLEQAGFRAEMNIKKQTLSIYPENPVQIDWSAMEDQWQDISLTQHEVESGLDAFHREVEMHQIMKACRG